MSCNRPNPGPRWRLSHVQWDRVALLPVLLAAIVAGWFYGCVSRAFRLGAEIGDRK